MYDEVGRDENIALCGGIRSVWRQDDYGNQV